MVIVSSYRPSSAYEVPFFLPVVALKFLPQSSFHVILKGQCAIGMFEKT